MIPINLLPLTSSDMQDFDYPDYDHKHPNLASIISSDVDNTLLRNANPPDGNSWECLDGLWNFRGPIAEHQVISESDCSGELQTATRTSSTANSADCHDATDFYFPLEWWPSDPSLDIIYGKDDNSTPPSTAIPYSPTTQNGTLKKSESVELSDRTATGNEPVLPTKVGSNGECLTAQKEHRIRNKLAAAKCRQRVKRGVDALQRRERDLLGENKRLSTLACFLREEVFQLKCEVLRHSQCNNDYIHRYIQQAAENASNP